MEKTAEEGRECTTAEGIDFQGQLRTTKGRAILSQLLEGSCTASLLNNGGAQGTIEKK